MSERADLGGYVAGGLIGGTFVACALGLLLTSETGRPMASTAWGIAAGLAIATFSLASGFRIELGAWPWSEGHRAGRRADSMEQKARALARELVAQREVEHLTAELQASREQSARNVEGMA